jgi:hypothetical protein
MNSDKHEYLPNPSAAERKRWWLLCYAYTSMEKVIQCCQMIEYLCPDNRHPLFSPLTVAVHAYYSRPFQRKKGAGKLSADLIPKERTGVHSWLLHFRDCVLVHTDAEKSEIAGRPMHDVVYSLDETGREFSTSDPLPRVESYTDAKAHCVAMAKIFRTKILTLEAQYSHLLPAEHGHFLMSLIDSEMLFVPHILPVSDTLHYHGT